MIIAIPVENKSMGSNVCASFGRAPYFLFFDTDKGESLFLENAAATSRGGAGIKAAQTLVDQKAEVLLAPRLGENAAEVLKAAEIKIYKTTAVSVKNNLEAFKAGQLDLLEEIHPGFHGAEAIK